MGEIPQDPYAAQAGAPGPGPGAYPGGPYPGPYPGPYGYGYPMQMGTNTLAILALVFAFIFAPAAIVMGVVARKQIRRTGEQGSGLATAGFVLGIVFTVFSVIWVIAMITIFAATVHQINVNQDNGNAAAMLAAARAYFAF